jgi:lysophospholipase L1-like esterase
VALVAALGLVVSAVLVTLVALRVADLGGDPDRSVRRPGTGAPAAVFVGDSITRGNSDLAAGRLGSRSWFTELVTGADAPLAYAGAIAENGRSTAWMADHVDDALALDPDLLVVLGGTNDVAAQVPPELIVLNLRRMAEAADEAGVAMAVATIPPLDVDGVDAEVAAANDAIRAFAAGAGVTLLDTGPAVAGPDGAWRPGLTDDGIHPNAEGAQRMAAAAAAAFRGAA